MRKSVNYCDYFVICSGNNSRQLLAISEYIEEKLKPMGINIHLSMSEKRSSWIVIDAGDVVVHVFQKDLRDFYQLEYLWQDAKKVVWEPKSKN